VTYVPNSSKLNFLPPETSILREGSMQGPDSTTCPAQNPEFLTMISIAGLARRFLTFELATVDASK